MFISEQRTNATKQLINHSNVGLEPIFEEDGFSRKKTVFIQNVLILNLESLLAFIFTSWPTRL